MKVNRKSGDAAVVLNQVVKQYTPGSAPAVDRISLQFDSGRLTTLLGPSGCGKSSLLKQWLPESGYPVHVWTKASAWPRPESGNLAAALGFEGVTLDLPGLFARVTGSALLVVDAAEACVDDSRIAQLERLLRLGRVFKIQGTMVRGI